MGMVKIMSSKIDGAFVERLAKSGLLTYLKNMGCDVVNTPRSRYSITITTPSGKELRYNGCWLTKRNHSTGTHQFHVCFEDYNISKYDGRKYRGATRFTPEELLARLKLEEAKRGWISGKKIELKVADPLGLLDKIQEKQKSDFEKAISNIENAETASELSAAMCSVIEGKTIEPRKYDGDRILDYAKAILVLADGNGGKRDRGIECLARAIVELTA
jgi:hypothetical protein